MGNEYPTQNYSYPVNYSNQNRPILLTTTKVDYFRDEYVEGNITLQNQIPIVLNDINLTLYLIESWTYTESSSHSFGEINNQPLLCIQVGIKNILKIDSDLINLSAGIFNFPFKFKLPNYLQPSFEYPFPDKRGFLRYSLEAKFISPYTQGSTSIYLIIKAKPKVLNTPLSYSSVMNIHKWGLIDEGTTILKVSYLTNNFKINETATIKVEINNLRGKLKVTNCEVNVYRKVGFLKKGSDLIKYKNENIMFQKVFPICVEPMNQKVYNFLIELKDSNKTNFNYLNVTNPYPNVVDISYLMPSTEGAIIKCEYEIVVILYFDSYVTNGYLPKVCLPISLTHQSQEEYNIEKQEDEDLQKAIEASKLDMQNEKGDEYINNNNDNNKNMSYVDKNRMDDLIDKPTGYDMKKLQPISQSQFIDNDNNGLPSKNEIENSRNKNNMNINQNNNMNDNVNQIYNNINNNMNNNMNSNMNNMNNMNNNMNNNNMNNINYNMNNINYNINNVNNMNNNMNINQNKNYNLPAPVWNQKNEEDEDELFNPYMGNQETKTNNNNNKLNTINNFSNINSNLNIISNNNQNNNQNNNNNNNINQNNNYINNNNPNYNENNYQIKQINIKEFNENNNNINDINRQDNNQINENINNKYPNYNNMNNQNVNEQKNNEINNNYPNFNNNNFSEINDKNKNIPLNQKNEENFTTVKEDKENFSIFNDNNGNSEKKEPAKYYDINEV